MMLGVTLIAMVVLILVLKKFKKMIPTIDGSLQVLSGAQLGTKSRIVLVEAKNTQILLGVTDTHIQTLYVFKDKAPFVECEKNA